MKQKNVWRIIKKQAKQAVMAFLFCCIGIALFAQLKPNKETGNQLKLIFTNKVSGQPLVLGNTYTNSFGENYTVQKFRFYITQLQIMDSSDMSVQFFPDDYFLVDAGDSSTRTIQIPLSLKHVSYLSFVLGVDSAKSVSGTQEGALDPANGMFWTWNTGYITAKLQGKSPSTQAPGNAFTFDAGGFKTGENVARKVELNINGGMRNRTIHTIVIATDINKWFDGAHPVKISEHPGGCHQPGELAMQLADNYATMFSVERISR